VLPVPGAGMHGWGRLCRCRPLLYYTAGLVRANPIRGAMSDSVTSATEPVRFPCGDLTLVGLLHRPQGSGLPGVAVCHPHPLYGGDMENNVVVALCRALAGGGMVALRFNFRGVGGSGGSYGGGFGERQDARAALDFLSGLTEVGSGRLGLAGYSFGALVALSAADERVRALAAVSPPAGGLDPAAFRSGIPTLLVSGDRDDVSPALRLPEMAASLGPPCEIRSVAGADHFWRGHEETLATTVLEFFRAQLRAPKP
jgi:alpha/beta superfamily hydrolase